MFDINRSRKWIILQLETIYRLFRTIHFTVLASQEIQQNSNLKSIEFGFNSIGNISIIVNLKLISFYNYNNLEYICL